MRSRKRDRFGPKEDLTRWTVRELVDSFEEDFREGVLDMDDFEPKVTEATFVADFVRRVALTYAVKRYGR